jgi:hypothetical protein
MDDIQRTPSPFPIDVPVVFDRIQEYYDSGRVFEAGLVAGITRMVNTTIATYLAFDGNTPASLEDAVNQCREELDKHHLKYYVDIGEVFKQVAQATEDEDYANLDEEYKQDYAYLNLECRLRLGLTRFTWEKLVPSGFVYYEKVLYDRPQGGKIGVAVSRRVERSEEIPQGVKFWPTAAVFLAGRYAGWRGQDFTFDDRPIGPIDLGMPTASAAVEECTICAQLPEENQQFLKLRNCGHEFCLRCILHWANEVPDVRVK